ncbi:SCO7613 C-terminal domain-containing membrane protein [Modestobacter sp. I12A-02662]|uniref:SCO7613 C-terminal domain-containing membrane protein n=1 Tax=Modestobacter sp. I12A-02662 TaxID=1730496 RepID=UPI0034DF50D8
MPRTPEVVYPPPVGSLPTPPPAPDDEDGLGQLTLQQVLLGAGAVALVAAGSASLGPRGWLLQATLALATAAASLLCGRRGLRASEETLAASAVVLVLISSRAADGTSAAVTVLGGLAVACLVLGLVRRTSVAWPLSAWVAGQAAVLTALDGWYQTRAMLVGTVLGTALVGLLVTRCARQPLAVLTLATTVPWWLTGVAWGLLLIWRTPELGVAAGIAALVVAAAAGLAWLRARQSLRPLLGPRAAVPVVAGVVAAAAVSGALDAAGRAGTSTSGYLGLAVATVVALTASPQPNAVARPTGLASATALTGLAGARLLATGHWSQLAGLLLAAALPALLVAARQPEDRPGALPVAVGCLTGAVLLTEADGALPVALAGPLLVVLALVALTGAALLRGHRSEVPLAGSAAAVAVVAVIDVARHGDLSPVAVSLAVLGAAGFGYAVLAGRQPARVAGCLALVAAAWLAAADVGTTVPEAYTLPAAVVLSLYAGHGLVDDPSWSTLGPALLTAFAPSTLLTLVDPDTPRVVLVVAGATVAVLVGHRWRLRAPFVVGAVSLVVVAVGRAVAWLPVPGLVALAAAGSALLAAGIRYEAGRRRRATQLPDHVADLR